jgi:hypothetical protein
LDEQYGEAGRSHSSAAPRQREIDFPIILALGVSARISFNARSMVLGYALCKAIVQAFRNRFAGANQKDRRSPQGIVLVSQPVAASRDSCRDIEHINGSVKGTSSPSNPIELC